MACLSSEFIRHPAIRYSRPSSASCSDLKWSCNWSLSSWGVIKKCYLTLLVSGDSHKNVPFGKILSLCTENSRHCPRSFSSGFWRNRKVDKSRDWSFTKLLQINFSQQHHMSKSTENWNKQGDLNNIFDFSVNEGESLETESFCPNRPLESNSAPEVLIQVTTLRTSDFLNLPVTPRGLNYLSILQTYPDIHFPKI